MSENLPTITVEKYDPWSLRWAIRRHLKHPGFQVVRGLTHHHITEYGILLRCGCGKERAW